MRTHSAAELHLKAVHSGRRADLSSLSSRSPDAPTTVEGWARERHRTKYRRSQPQDFVGHMPDNVSLNAR